MGSPAAAQQSVDYASVSGRVTDPSGAVVAGAQVTARTRDTNVTATTVTDRTAGSVFPICGSAPYEIAVSQPGFQDATRTLDADRRRGLRAAGHARPSAPSTPA